MKSVSGRSEGLVRKGEVFAFGGSIQNLKGLIKIQRTHRGTSDLSSRSFAFDFCQRGPTKRPSVERPAEKAFLLPGRVQLSIAEARVEGMVSGSGGAGGGIPAH